MKRRLSFWLRRLSYFLDPVGFQQEFEQVMQLQQALQIKDWLENPPFYPLSDEGVDDRPVLH